MIKFLKKWWYLFTIALIINSFLVFTCVKKSGNELTMPGGLNEVSSLLTIDSDFDLKGSFNTIYVYSYEEATLMQSFLAGLDHKNEVYETNSDFDLTREESYLSGVIQKNQSIEACLIASYEAANKHDPEIKLDYEFLGFIVYTYKKNQEVLKIGDIITKVKVKKGDTYEEVTKDNIEALADAINQVKKGDIITFIRNDEVLEYEVSLDITRENKNSFYGYPKYLLNSSKSSPTFKVNEAKTLGPSGGLLQSLAVYSQLTNNDLTKGYKISGTGMIYPSGKVGAIGGVSQKIITALKNNVKVFFCPSSNYEEAKKTYDSIRNHERMALVEIHSLSEAILYLENNL